MSAGRCGVCGAPTMTGASCATHWRELLALLDRCEGLEADLQSAIGRQGRHGEQVRASSVHPGIPVNLAASEARGRLLGALSAALGRLRIDEWAWTVDGAAEALKVAQGALQRSWAAPVLLVDLRSFVPAAVAATDTPRSRPGVRGVCPRCGERTFLALTGGAFSCGQCREVIPWREVQGAD